MSISSNLKDHAATITLVNRFDFITVKEFRQVYSAVKAKSYIVDFRHTEYMNSSGLGMLLNRRLHLKDLKAAIKLTNCRPQVKNALLIS
ncbi:MAG: anti-anti-sigma factor [Oceanicoccus sp.]|jgi:anti-anti-sigma factor